jgi:branched-chain amino acid transport system substrate-binding protein
MRISGRLWRVLALLLAFALVAAACGDDDDDTADEDTTETTAAAEDEGEDTEDTTDDTEATEEGEGDGEAAEPVAPDTDSLTLGTVLPETGQLAFLGPPMVEAVNMAVRDVNDAGGVLGSDVELVTGDSGTDPDVANTTVDRLLAEPVNGIVGAAASGITRQVVDKVTGAGVVMCSPSNTAQDLLNAGNDGFYFRTAPGDQLQGAVLGELIVGDGNANVAILARADEYGAGFAEALASSIQESGGNVVLNETYDPNATNFDAEVQAVAAESPDAVALITFEEGVQIIQTMIEQGVGPDAVQIYIADGLATGDLGELIDPENPGVAEGIRGTAPSATPENGADFFADAFAEFAPDTDLIFSAQAYDCAVTMALAAAQAGTADPAAIRDNMSPVTRDGTVCTTFAECIELIDAGEDIDYDGASGPIDFPEGSSDPSVATYDVYEYDADGVQQVQGQEVLQ